MESADEFGNLYTDVLQLASTTSKPSPPPSRAQNDDNDCRDRVFLGACSGSAPSPLPSQLPARTVAQAGGDEDWTHGQPAVAEEQPLEWSDGEDEGLSRDSSGQVMVLLPHRSGVFGVLMKEEEEEVAAGLGEAAPHEEVGENEGGVGFAEEVGACVPGRDAVVTSHVDNGTVDLDQEPVIPGLSVSSVRPGAIDGTENVDAKVSRSDDWDSDSEDDLQIVLNDDNLGLPSGNRTLAAGVEDDEDEDGEEDDLVFVTDEDQQQRHLDHHHLEMEEQNGGEGLMQQPLDGARKEKSGGEIGTVGMAKIGYSSHGYHGQHPSQFKYMRPGVAPIPGVGAAGTGAASGQVHPPFNMGPIAGRGRGAQKSFHSGYGLILWSSGTSGRANGNGLEFTLPSRKTIFEIDIDDFEAKPWRVPGVDVSDFFNFGLNEEKWRLFCKHLERLRLEATMRSKICVYESEQSEQDYDPDLPPELVAAAGLHRISAESTQHGKADGNQSDLIGHGRGALRFQPQLPIGRAIQVESNFSERLPSIDTRPPRVRDSDTIIEIALQDSIDVCCVDLEEQLYDPQGLDVEGDHKDEDSDKRTDAEHFDQFPPSCSGEKRVFLKRKGSPLGSIHNKVPEGNGFLPFPSDASSNDLPNSKSQTPVIAGGHCAAFRAARQTQSNASAECSNDAISSHNVNLQIHDGRKERSGDRIEDEGILQISPVAPLETDVEVRLEKRSDEHTNKLVLDDDAETEKEEMASDLQLSCEYHEDNGPYYAVKRHKLSSRVEQLAVLDKDNGDDSRATHSDSSIAKSGNSKDCAEKHKSGEEEVMQGGETRQIRDLTGHHHEERSFQQRDDYGQHGRHDMNRSCFTYKQREDMHHSRLHRERDSTNYGCRSEAFGSRKEKEDSFGCCLRREDDSYGRKGKDEDRKQDHDDEIGSRHRNEVRASKRKGKDEDLHSSKYIGDGDWKGHCDRDGVLRQREKNGISMSRHGNFDELHARKRKGVEQPSREEIAKKDVLHLRKGMEGTKHSKKEKNDGVNYKTREDQTCAREKGDNSFTKCQGDNLRHREREDRRLNKPNEDVHRHKKIKEGHTRLKRGRVLDDRRMGGVERVNNVSKGLGLDDYPHKDKRQCREHHKRGNHIEEHTRAQHKAQQKVYPPENQSTNREKSLKNERFSSHSNYPSAASDNQQVCRERHREASRKNKESKGYWTGFLEAGKRRHEDQKHHLIDKVTAKDSNVSSGVLSKKARHLPDKHSDLQEQHHSSGNHAEEDVASDDDDSSQNVRRGRSKLERWTSHEERDYSNSSPQPLASSSRARESGVGNIDTIQLGDSIKNEDGTVNSGAADAEFVQRDHVEEEGDCHLDAGGDASNLIIPCQERTQ